MTNREIVITDIQRFCLHDGPGLRTTVFMKGCSLHCPWCCNPETQGKVCVEKTGRIVSEDELKNICIKDKEFYFDDIEMGGITLSGGEPLLQMSKLIPFCSWLKKEGISIAIETSLYAPEEFVRASVEWIDYYYIDIKLLNPSKVYEIEGGNLQLYLSNLEWLASCKSRKGSITIRIPVIGGYTDSNCNIAATEVLLNRIKHNITGVELLKAHFISKDKYKKLGIEMPIYNDNVDYAINKYQKKIEGLNIPVKVMKL